MTRSAFIPTKRLRAVLRLAAFLLSANAIVWAQPAVSTTVDPTHGFPIWYQDGSLPAGVRVEPCLDAASGKCVLLADPGFNPANPIVFPSNFPSEFFYAIADADKLTSPGCPASGIAAGGNTQQRHNNGAQALSSYRQ